MKKGWEVRKFEKCIQKIKSTKKIPKKQFLSDGIYPIISQERDFINGYWNNETDVLKVDKPIVIFGDHTKVVKLVDFDFVKGADGVVTLLPIENINSVFFAYQLQNIKLRDLGYARHYRLLKENDIVFPPLAEQKQIVAILDKAFAAIDQAKANIEKNIANAKELFQSKLNDIFSQTGDGWVEKTWKEIVDIRSGRNQKTVENPNGKYPILGSAGKIMGYADNYICEEGTTIIGRKGTINSPIYIDTKFWNVDTAFGLHAKEGLNKEYLYYFCLSYDFTQRDKGSGRPSLVKNDLLKMVMKIPSEEMQIEIVEKCKNIKNYLVIVEAQYKQKLTNLEELKKSILQKAFRGELTE